MRRAFPSNEFLSQSRSIRRAPYRFPGPLVCGALLLVIASCQRTAAPAEHAEKPNIVFMLADDAGWNDVGYHGSKIKTPHIDSLARSGLELDRFYVHHSCTPTRAGLISGRNPSRYGILNPSGQSLPEDALTLPGALKQVGYQTAMVGKWHLGLTPEVGPRKYGFDYSYGHFHGEVDKYTHRYETGERTWHRNDEYVDEEGHASDLITDEAIRYIREIRSSQEPFFLYVAFGNPHHPFQEEEKWLEPYRELFDSEGRRLFAAAMTHLDDNVGRIVSTLVDERLLENTLLFFVSDNGAQERKVFSEREYEGKFGPLDRLGDDRPLRGWKFGLYEGGIRVPALVSWRGHLKPGLVTEVLAIEDILPTLAALTGSPIPADVELDGKNFWPVLEESGSLQPRILFWQTPGQLAVREGPWKLIHLGGTPAEGVDELYDLDMDPYETHNLLSERPDKAEELLQELESSFQKLTPEN